MTPLEFDALKQEHEKHLWRWGMERAQFCNANFKRQDGARFVPEDFYAPHKAEAARQAQQRQAASDKLEELQVNIATMLTNVEESRLPAWAKPEFHRAHQGVSHG